MIWWNYKYHSKVSNYVIQLFKSKLRRCLSNSFISFVQFILFYRNTFISDRDVPLSIHFFFISMRFWENDREMIGWCPATFSVGAPQSVKTWIHHCPFF